MDKSWNLWKYIRKSVCLSLQEGWVETTSMRPRKSKTNVILNMDDMARNVLDCDEQRVCIFIFIALLHAKLNLQGYK